MDQIKIGVLVNTHGLKGEVKVKPTTQFPDIRFQKGKVIHVQFERELIEVKIKQVRDQKDMLLVTFEGYDHINLVEKWKGSTLSIDKSNVHELDEDEAYFFELLDCDVYDGSNTYLGKVSEVIETGANAVLRVTLDGKDVLIPYVEAFVKELQKEEKRIVVALMDGML